MRFQVQNGEVSNGMVAGIERLDKYFEELWNENNESEDGLNFLG